MTAAELHALADALFAELEAAHAGSDGDEARAATYQKVLIRFALSGVHESAKGDAARVIEPPDVA